MARRVPEYEKRRNTRLGSWAVILVLCATAWDSGKFSYWGLPLMVWGVYELLLAPTRCRARTRRNGLCRHFCYGLLKGCKQQPSHGPGKRADLFRALTGARPVRAAENSAFQSQPIPGPEAVTVEPTQRAVIVFTIVGGIAGVIQTVFAAFSLA